jgi:hypothetical protein
MRPRRPPDQRNRAASERGPTRQEKEKHRAGGELEAGLDREPVEPVDMEMRQRGEFHDDVSSIARATGSSSSISSSSSSSVRKMKMKMKK